MAVTGSMWQLQGLCGSNRVCGSNSMWQLQGLCGNYRVYVAVLQGLCGSRGLCGSNRVYLAVTGSVWQ